MKPKIIITGSEGVVGKILRNSLSREYDIYGIDKKGGNEGKFCKADIADFGEMVDVFQKIGEADFLIHLAAESRVDADWNSILKNNIIGVKNCYDCARKFGIRKVIFSSTNHVTGGYEKDIETFQKNKKLISIYDALRPDSDYASSKIFGEAIARQYYDNYGITSICLRIGSVLEDDNPKGDKRLVKTWLSHRDLVQLFIKSIESRVPFGVYYGVSNNRDRFWDISNAQKELNYEPQDDSSRW